MQTPGFRLIAATGAIVLLGAAGAMQPAGHEHEAAGGSMPAMCQQMMSQHEHMQQQMAAMDARLDQLVATMRTARGAARTDAIAAVVEELVKQRSAARGMMMGMSHDMATHQMHLMMSRAPAEMRQQMHAHMAACPMMGMSHGSQAQPPAPPQGGHEGHHPK